MSMFDTFDRTGVAQFSYPREVVFKAVELAVGQVSGMDIVSSSSAAGFIDVKSGMSALSWGENIKISVLSSGPNLTNIEVASAGKTVFGSMWTHSKNQKNVRSLIQATSKVLEAHGNEWLQEISPVSAPDDSKDSESLPSMADELKKFAELRDAGILTEAEFESQKIRLLNL